MPVKRLLCGTKIHYESSLHLGVSIRSFRSEKLSAFVKALLDNQPEIAAGFYSELSVSYPIFVTRNFASAKEWIRAKARGTERYGLLASSEGKRLRGEGIWVLPEIKHVSWFLNGKDNVDPSYYLEVAASEFKVQGLEIDYGLLAWDIDLRYVNGNFDHYCFRGTSWNHINIPQRQIVNDKERPKSETQRTIDSSIPAFADCDFQSRFFSASGYPLQSRWA